MEPVSGRMTPPLPMEGPPLARRQEEKILAITRRSWKTYSTDCCCRPASCCALSSDVAGCITIGWGIHLGSTVIGALGGVSFLSGAALHLYLSRSLQRERERRALEELFEQGAQATHDLEMAACSISSSVEGITQQNTVVDNQLDKIDRILLDFKSLPQEIPPIGWVPSMQTSLQRLEASQRRLRDMLDPPEDPLANQPAPSYDPERSSASQEL